MIKSCAAIVIAAKHGVLTKVKDASGIAHTVGTLRCKFEFRTTDWDYTTRTAVFCKGDVSTNPKVVDTAIGVKLDGIDECAVPPEVLLPDEKYFSVGVWGVTNDGLRIVSEWLVFRIKDGCYVDSAESFLPTPSVYEQIITDLNLKAPIDHKHEEYVLEETLLETMKEFVVDTAQSDWNQTDTTQMDYIKNKPDIDAKLSGMATIDEELINRTEPDPNRPFSRDLYNILVNRERVYVEKSAKDGKGVNSLYYLSSNSDRVFNPWGYKSIEAMCNAWGWDPATITEGVHYTEAKIDGVTTYHALLSSVVARTADGNIRVATTPNSSTDATSKNYVDGKLGLKIDKNAIWEGNKDNCVLARVANGGSYYAIPTALNPLNKVDIPQRNAKGELMCNIDSTSSSKACVNKDYLAQKFGGDGVYVSLNPVSGSLTIPQRNTSGEMRCAVSDSSDSTSCVNKKYLNTKITELNTDIKKTVTEINNRAVEANNKANGIYNLANNALSIANIALDDVRAEEQRATEAENALDNKIDEIEGLAKGANQAVVFGNYQTMISTLNNSSKDAYKIGQNILIVTLNVPDLWVSDKTNLTSVYAYTSDEDFTVALKENGSVQVGYYILSALETQKVDITGYPTNEEVDEKLKPYVKSTDYAVNATDGGVVKIGKDLGIGQFNSGASAWMLYINQAQDAVITGRHTHSRAIYSPITAGNLDFAIKEGVTNNGITLTDDDKAKASEWLGYVKPTDYADGNNAGVVKVPHGDTSRGIYRSNAGTILLGNLQSYIDDRTAGRAIRNEDLDYAVMKSLTDPKTHEWTDTEKVSACNTIGALKKPALPTRRAVVAMQADGTTNTSQIVHESATPWSVPCRDDNGCIKTASAKAGGDAVNLDDLNAKTKGGVGEWIEATKQSNTDYQIKLYESGVYEYFYYLNNSIPQSSVWYSNTLVYDKSSITDYKVETRFETIDKFANISIAMSSGEEGATIAVFLKDPDPEGFSPSSNVVIKARKIREI